MPVFQKPVYVQQFCELDTGKAFVLVKDLAKVGQSPSIFRKIDCSTAHTESWGDDGCSNGAVTIVPDTEVIELQ